MYCTYRLRFLSSNIYNLHYNEFSLQETFAQTRAQLVGRLSAAGVQRGEHDATPIVATPLPASDVKMV